MTQQSDALTLRQKSHQYLWMHNRDWLQMAEEGEPMIVVQGDGIRITDIEGNRWIDVNGGYNSVNVGYGRHEIADAAFEQMNRISYFPNGTTTEPTALLSKKLAEMTPGSLIEGLSGLRRLGGERDRHQDSSRVPSQKRRASAVQDNQPSGVLSWDDRRRALAWRVSACAPPRF